MNKKQLLLPVLVCLLPMLVGAVLYQQMPDQIPVHWNSTGEIDDYGAKELVLFGFPIFFALAEVLMYACISTDPKKQNQSNKIKTLCLWLMPVTLLVVYFVSITAAMGYDVNVVSIICIFLGAVFVIMGNYLPKCKQNYTIGYRISWTLNDEENWNKTHRLAGYLWMLGGFVLIILALLVYDALVLFAVTIGLLILTFIPMIYSYLLYRRKDNACD